MKYLILAILFFLATVFISDRISIHGGCPADGFDFENISQYYPRLIKPQEPSPIRIGNVVEYGCSIDRKIYPVETIVLTPVFASLGLLSLVSKVASQIVAKVKGPYKES